MLYPFNLSFSLSLLFMGFLFANFFGIITSTKNIIFLFIACIELINCLVYTQKLYPFTRTRAFLASIPVRFTSNRLFASILRNLTFGLRAKPSWTEDKVRRILMHEKSKIIAEKPKIFEKVNQTSFFRRILFLTKKRRASSEPYLIDSLPYSGERSKAKVQGNKNRFKESKIPFGSEQASSISEKNTIIINYVFTILNFLKIGFEFGFFIDAFKLGS